MFQSFFPKPLLFFGSFVIWALACLSFWFVWGHPAGEMLSLGEWFGFIHLDFELLDTLEKEAEKFTLKTDPEHMRLVGAQIEALEGAATFWTYQFLIPCYGLFIGCWYFASSHKWLKWSLLGSALIIFCTWFQVQLDVMLNEWFGGFYNMIPIMFTNPGTIESAEYYGRLLTFFKIAAVFVIVATLSGYFIQHYNFRWRTAMTEYYTGLWPRIRGIKGASQRIQEDTKRLAEIMETLGVGLLDAVMTLAAFLPILWILSDKWISAIPIVGPIAHGLVIVAVVWSIFGTLVLMLTGYHLPMLNVYNQTVEAELRKELVLGEDDAKRAQPMTLRELFADVRKNYFRMYFHYMYFNVVRYSYLQASVLVPYFALAPTLISKEAILAGFTYGIMQQIVRAFGRVGSSFQYLVQNYPTIIEMLSIYKRLKLFDKAIRNQPLLKTDEA